MAPATDPYAAPVGGGSRELERDASLVLLAGGMTPPPLSQALGLCLLDLPVVAGTTVLGAWERAFHGRDGSGSVGAGRLEEQARRGDVCVSVSPSSVPPSRAPDEVLVSDRDGYRGPAGALLDTVEARGISGRVIVAEGFRVPPEALWGIVEAHDRLGASVTIGVSQGGRPSGVYVAEPEAIDRIARRGFIDLKEQWLRAVRSAGLRVAFHRFTGDCTGSVRTRADYLRITGCMAERGPAPARGPSVIVSDPGDPLSPRLRASPALVEAGAEVGEGAVLEGSVVLAGGRVGPGAVVVRSVIGPQAVIPAGSVVVDSVVAPGASARRAAARKGGRVARLARHFAVPGLGGLARRGQRAGA